MNFIKFVTLGLFLTSISARGNSSGLLDVEYLKSENDQLCARKAETLYKKKILKMKEDLENEIRSALENRFSPQYKIKSIQRIKDWTYTTSLESFPLARFSPDKFGNDEDGGFFRGAAHIIYTHENKMPHLNWGLYFDVRNQAELNQAPAVKAHLGNPNSVYYQIRSRILLNTLEYRVEFVGANPIIITMVHNINDNYYNKPFKVDLFLHFNPNLFRFKALKEPIESNTSLFNICSIKYGDGDDKYTITLRTEIDGKVIDLVTIPRKNFTHYEEVFENIAAP